MKKNSKEIIKAKCRILGIFRFVMLAIAILCMYFVFMQAFYYFARRGELTPRDHLYTIWYIIASVGFLYYSSEIAIRILYR